MTDETGPPPGIGCIAAKIRWRGTRRLDCNWPLCHCDPAANRVTDALRVGNMLRDPGAGQGRSDEECLIYGK